MMEDLDRQQFLARQLSSQYELLYSELDIGNEIYHLVQVGNVDQLLDNLIAKGPDDPAVQDEQIPYWADLWHAAIGMATYLHEANLIKPNHEVLEIGCGIGLPGIVAAKLGAHVTLTDYLSEALELAEYVALLNGLASIHFQLMDWREPIPNLKVDVLLASDVAYEKRTWKPLLRAFRQLVKPGGKIVLSEPGRPITQPWLEALQQAEYQVTEKRIPISFRKIENLVRVLVLEAPSS